MGPVERGRQAQRILEDPVFIEAYSTARNLLSELFFHTEVGDTTTRESLYHQSRALDLIQGQLKIMVEDGAQALRKENAPAG